MASQEQTVARILIIEDEENLRFSVSRSLTKAGHEVFEGESIGSARGVSQRESLDLVLTDVHLGEEDGLEFVRELRADGFDGVIIVMTAYGSVEHAVEAMRDGANDYLQKPIVIEELLIQLPRWLEHRRLSQKVELYERLERTREQGRKVLGQSAAWLKCLDLSARLAQMPLGADPGGALPTILLLGETGVGKGVLARYIHDMAVERQPSSTKDEPPFVHVNCSALPASLVEGELFGHEKGAFTDARTSRTGLFEMADGGTIFLDEISEMPLELQAKLLVVVEQGTFRRVGGSRERKVRARVIAASNQELESLAEDGKFRRDLFFRLAAFPIEIPPLREREQDALLIARELLEDMGARYGRDGLDLSPACESAILSHRWAGNVRELANAIQRAAMLSETKMVEAADIGIAHPRAGIEHSNGKATPIGGTPRFDFERGMHKVDQVEQALMLQALEHTRGNVSKASKLIGMQRSSFRYRIERYGLEDKVREIAERTS